MTKAEQLVERWVKAHDADRVWIDLAGSSDASLDRLVIESRAMVRMAKTRERTSQDAAQA